MPKFCISLTALADLLYPDDFWVDIDYSPKLEDVNYLKKYDIIHYHRSLGPDYNRSAKAVKLIQNF